MNKNAEEKVWLVIVVIGEHREIFGCPSKQSAQLFFNELKEEVDEIYLATEPVVKKAEHVVV